MEDKITIIEGPPPTFEAVQDDWVWGLNESPTLAEIVVTRLRTFNGPALVERCHRAWRHQQAIHLEFRDLDGLTHESPIVAARAVETDGGQMLLLWLRLPNEGVELALDYEDDSEMDEDEDPDFKL